MSITRYSLPVQIVVSFIALVILTAAAVGLPAIWVIRAQMDRQAWTLVEQGSRTARALYATQQSELDNLAILTSERPTLLELLQQGDPAKQLPAYLKTIQTGAGLDFVVVCEDGKPLAQAGQNIPADICQSGASPQADGTARLLAAHPVSTGLQVVVGRVLDQEFADQMREKTGMDQTVLVRGRPSASSFDNIDSAWRAMSGAKDAGSPDAGSSLQRSSFVFDNIPYYSVRFQINETGLENIVSLPVTSIASAERALTKDILMGILIIAGLGSILGVILAQRIIRPLNRLSEAAVALRKGDLVTPLSVRTKVPEIALVAYSLEDARVALHHTIRELRQEKAWVEHLLESIVEGIVTMDQHGRITFFSQAAERISGLKQEQVLHRSIDEVFIPAEGAGTFTQLLPAAGGKQKITISLRNGRQATLAVTGARLAPPEAGKARVALVLRDVSDEEAIRRLLGDFLANISHEFRTPLSALAASIELLLDQLPDLSLAELQELLNSLHLGILGLQTLIDNLLEGASIEAGHFRVYPRPVDLAEIVEEARRIIQPLLDKYGQKLAIQLPTGLPPVQADARRTIQVLVNLLSNAVKYGPHEAEILLGVDQQANQARVTVSDQGPGIPPEHKPELFHRFAHIQTGNSRAEYGAGLGLSVVKAIVEAQGGQVGVLDRSPGGTTFWFTLLFSTAEQIDANDPKDEKAQEER